MGFGSKPNSLFVSEANLQQDEEGHFVWKILNRRVGTLAHASRRVLKVKKIRVVPGELRFPLLALSYCVKCRLRTVRNLTRPWI